MSDQPAPPAPTPGWLKPISAESWFLLPEPEVRWLIDGLVPVESLVMISGPRKKSYKTWLAMLIGILSGGGLTYKQYPGWKARAPANVLFLEQESTQHDNRRRFQNLMEGQGLARGDWRGPGKFFWQLRSQFKADNPQMVLDLIRYMQTEQIKLLVLDSLTFMHRGEANSERDMGVVALALADIRAATGATVLWLSHTNKEGEALDRDPDLDVRGSTIILDVYDAHIAIRRKKRAILSTTLRFRESPEKEVEFFWHLPPMDEQGNPIPGPAYLDVIDVTGEKRETDALGRLLQAGWLPGQFHSTIAFRTALGMRAGPASELRAKMISEGKLVVAPNGQDVALPKGA